MFTVTPTMLYLAIGVLMLLVMGALAHFHIELASRLKKLNVMEDTQVSYFMSAFALMCVVVPVFVFVFCVGMLMYHMQTSAAI